MIIMYVNPRQYRQVSTTLIHENDEKHDKLDILFVQIIEWTPKV